MRPDEIRAHLRKQPFLPIRIYVSAGSSYEVRHPEMMFVTRAEVIIGLGDDDMPERCVSCDPLHIARIEPLNGRRRKRASTGMK